jgi:preprotein translocase subunit SecE
MKAIKIITKFFHEVRTELAKVTWPTRSDALNLTIAVVLVSALVTAYVGGVDYLLTQGVKWLAVASETLKSQSSANSNPQTIPIDLGNIDVNATPSK